MTVKAGKILRKTSWLNHPEEMQAFGEQISNIFLENSNGV